MPPQNRLNRRILAARAATQPGMVLAQTSASLTLAENWNR